MEGSCFFAGKSKNRDFQRSPLTAVALDLPAAIMRAGIL